MYANKYVIFIQNYPHGNYEPLPNKLYEKQTQIFQESLKH